ncbi:FGGY family carbohydrate kinase [Micromonospora aurantiaca]|uniref:Carbohydrate kinase n=1 Tax=Micromonospora aurantiaca (nom. illeg.) TaxID=47850 RepID=A0A3M9KD07_9ACTN|nr:MULTISPECIES: FGGY family carbohydrate kinase [Micromonospora]ADL47684.1 Carbohydrate kinase, FGGY-like [Micromonospora aurantiaca ATCC 27029]ADU09641.1 Carbohydrate kinase, FGGY-like protein [Micromonospora sp. L5]AXH93759.1 carbohydrate kinase [Micromonospora aurantiaca]RNH98888.1 carbohydrate kinase [Micromonospora aurantiaca]
MDILALDLGTSSVRGLVLDADAVPRPGALARRRVRLVTGDDGSGTLDGPAYLACLVECLDELAAGGHLRDVDLVATSAQWHSVLPVAPDGTPSGPVLTWLDTRPEPLPGATGPADPADFHGRTGTWWHRCYWSVRLPWLRERVDGSARFTGLAEYVLGTLLDDAPMSISLASGTGLLDLRRLDWDPEACELAGVRPDQMLRLAPDGWHGRLNAAYARRWPQLAGARWAPPVGDGAAANVGSGCVDPTRAAVTVGTSAAVRMIQAVPAGAEPPPLPEQLWRYRVDHNHVVTGAAYSSGGNLFAWAARELRLPEGTELEAALDRVAGSVRANPRFGGDRPPGVAPAGSGELRGLSFGTTAVDILAGLMSGLCRLVADDLTLLEAGIGEPMEVILGGGALTASPWWRGAFLDVLAPRRVCWQRNPEIGATGAALVALGRLTEADEIAGIGRTDEAASHA